MAVSTRKVFAVWALLASAARADAAATREQAPITLDAQSTEVDLRTDNMVFHKVRISQGGMSVTADQGQSVTADQGQATKRTTGLDFDNSVWVFRGSVKITFDQGLLTADEAKITFADKALSKAVATGDPAAFEQRIAKTGKVAQGHAATIDYDVSKGIVRLQKNAYLTDGQNEIRGEALKYNVAAQNVIAEEAEQGSQRVHIIITPPPAKTPPAPGKP
jgi:lipopolysaccharide export system protein LptA